VAERFNRTLKDQAILQSEKGGPQGRLLSGHAPLAGKCAGWGENILGLEKNQPRLPPHEPEIGVNSGLRELCSGLKVVLWASVHKFPFGAVTPTTTAWDDTGNGTGTMVTDGTVAFSLPLASRVRQ